MPKKNAEIKLRFHSGVDVKIHDGSVMLEGNEGKMALIPITDQEFSIKTGRHPSQMVNATQSFNWIDYFDVEFMSSSKNTLFSNLILPVKDQNQMKKIMSSKKMEMLENGDMKLSFDYENQTFEYHFNKTKTGIYTG